MIPISALGGGCGGRPGGGGGMISLSSLGGGGACGLLPQSMAPMTAGGQPVGREVPQSFLSNIMNPPPRTQETLSTNEGGDCDTLAEIGKSAKEHLDTLQPIAIPKDDSPCPKQLAVLENNTDLFKMFDVDYYRFDEKALKRGYHKLAAYVHPDKLGREPTAADKARYTKLKQAYTVLNDEQMRAVYRQHCFGISGSAGCPPLGHEAALAKALEMGRDLRKASEERAIVLHKATETGWTVQQKDADGRIMRTDTRKTAHQFNLFGDITSSEDDEVLEKERRGMKPSDILERSPRYADVFLEKAKELLLNKHISNPAAGGAFTVYEDPRALEFLKEYPKVVQKHLRRLRDAIKQMNWAMTSLLQNKESPWRGLETKASLAEHAIVKLISTVKSSIAFGKFGEVQEEEFLKVIDQVHRLYMDLYERRGQELLRGAINAEIMVVHLLPESEGRLPDGTRVILQSLVSRADLNGKGGTVTGWDYSLQRYCVEVDQEEKKTGLALPSNPDLLGVNDMDDADEEDAEENESKAELAIPKKLMLMPKNAQVDLNPAKKRLETLVKDWNAWRLRPRSVSATQDAEAVAAALGPPLESMASYLREGCSAVSTAASCPDGIDLVADECREALSSARNLAAKLLGEEPKEPPPAPSMITPPAPIVLVKPLDAAAQALKEAAEMAAMNIKIKVPEPKKKKRSRSRSRKRRRRSSSSSSSGKKKKKR